MSATVHCLIFDDPKDSRAVPDWLLVLNSECKTAADARTLLRDRVLNCEAFATERCACIPRAVYDSRNKNNGRRVLIDGVEQS